MLAISNAVVILGVSFYLKLPSGAFSWRQLGTATVEAIPALLMPILILGGLYGGVFTPTEAGAAACAYALAYGFMAKPGLFVRELVPATFRAINLTRSAESRGGTECVSTFRYRWAPDH